MQIPSGLDCLAHQCQGHLVISKPIPTNIALKDCGSYRLGTSGNDVNDVHDKNMPS